MRQLVSASYVALFACVAAPSLVASDPYDEKRVVAYAKSIDVSKLDSALPSQGLEDWLHAGPPRAEKVEWRLSEDCDLKADDGGPKEHRPLCVKLTFHRTPTVAGWALLKIGTRGKGINGPPHFEYAVVQAASPPALAGRVAKKLSDIPKLMDELGQTTK